jgi:hypothetical protein
MIVIQYGDKYGVFTDDGVLVEGGFASRHEAVEARERMTTDSVPAVEPEVVEKKTRPAKRKVK